MNSLDDDSSQYSSCMLYIFIFILIYGTPYKTPILKDDIYLHILVPIP